MKQIHLALFHPKHAGILSAAIELKPDELILLHRQEDDISGLKSALRARGIQCINQVMRFETQAARNQVAKIITQHASHHLTLNASSGYNKLILIAFEQFSVNELPVFMIDKFTDQLHWLNTFNSKNETTQQANQQDFHLSHQIKLKEYLNTFNTQIIEPGQTTPEAEISRDLTDWIISQLGAVDKAIASLNYMAMSADSSHKYHMSQHDLNNHPLQQLLDKFEATNLLTVRGKKLQFKNKQSRFYCNGGWLENHVYALLYGMRKNRPALTDLAKGMTIERNKGAVRNELDVAAICHNRLHIIECKTRRFKNSKAGNSAANSAIYRLDTIKSISGGHSGKAMLISYQALNKYTLSRAKDLGILCCSFTQLQQLERHLYQFLDE